MAGVASIKRNLEEEDKQFKDSYKQGAELVYNKSAQWEDTDMAEDDKMIAGDSYENINITIGKEDTPTPQGKTGEAVKDDNKQSMASKVAPWIAAAAIPAAGLAGYAMKNTPTTSATENTQSLLEKDSAPQ